MLLQLLSAPQSDIQLLGTEKLRRQLRCLMLARAHDSAMSGSMADVCARMVTISL